MRLPKTFAVAAVTLVASFAAAHAAASSGSGWYPECEGGQNVGFVVGSTTATAVRLPQQDRCAAAALHRARPALRS